MSLKGQYVTYDTLESDKKIEDVTFRELAIEYKKRTLKEFEENYKEELKPKFSSTESSFFAILKNLNFEGQNEGQNEGQSEGKKLKPKHRQEKIIEIMRNTPNTTAFELSKIFLVSISTIERDLKKLTDEKMIEYTGSAKDGYWIVK